MGRIIIFTGKGGVGKTSVAAAHAVKSAAEGKKTLLVSADMAHNLGDIFQTEVGSRVRELEARLYGLELDPDLLLEEEFPDVAQAIADLVQGEGLAARDLGGHFLIPGFENLFSLLKIAQLHQSGEYDRILVDCAPTGETLSLLKLPELLAWYLEKFFPVGKTMVRVLSPVSRLRYNVRLPDRKAMNQMEEMHLRLLALQNLLKDGSVCSVRLVCTPEKMVVEETKRNYMYLNLYGYQVDGVFINRVLPEAADNGFLAGWRGIQAGYLAELRRVFAGLPLWEIPWYPEEIRGREAIGRLCREILTDPDLFEVRAHTEHEVYEAIPGGYRLALSLPFAREGQAQVSVHGLDLDISVNNYLRRIPLPNVLRGVAPAEVSLEGGVLRVSFLTGETDSSAGAPEKEAAGQ